MKKLVYSKVFDIAWGDMDALQHVNNCRYFDYFQEARIQWLETLGVSLADKQGPVVIHIAATFLKPVVYPARLKLDCLLHTLGRSSMCLDHNIYQNDILMTEGQCKIVWVDYEANKSIALPEKILKIYSV